MSEARASFAAVLDRVEQGDPVRVTRAGKPVAVIVSLDQYREGELGAGSATKAFRSFMKNLDQRALKGPDPWRGTRDETPGRDFRW
ncbi:MAG TPA: type II toxin-antitoxin system Phd/YefM family antitoxin [Polyangiaceae bacterium]|nr:type II toxin-antitoxin system Phd/YefM family antitoxin [Polyangiaceae bacterium]